LRRRRRKDVRRRFDVLFESVDVDVLREQEFAEIREHFAVVVVVAAAAGAAAGARAAAVVVVVDDGDDDVSVPRIVYFSSNLRSTAFASLASLF
jgi:hypothetical protein